MARIWVNKSGQSLIETGKSAPTITTVCKLAKDLDLKASELIKLYEEKIDST